MPIFAIISQPSSTGERLPGVIAREFKNDHMQLGTGQWVVAAPMTAKELSDKLGITDGSNGSALVLEVSSYYGRASNNIWSWIKNKWEGSNG